MKYYTLLEKILAQGKVQQNKKGGIIYLMNEVLSMDESEKNKICEAARKNIEDNFSNQKMYQSTIDLYNKVLG